MGWDFCQLGDHIFHPSKHAVTNGTSLRRSSVETGNDDKIIWNNSIVVFATWQHHGLQIVFPGFAQWWSPDSEKERSRMISMGLTRRLRKDGGNCDMKQKKMSLSNWHITYWKSNACKMSDACFPILAKTVAILMTNLDGSGFAILGFWYRHC